MEKPVENRGKIGRRRTAPPAAMKELTEAAARKLVTGRFSSYQTKWEATHQIKYQCNLSLEEAAALEAVKRKTCPTLTRYGLVRSLLLALIDEGEKGEDGGEPESGHK